MAYPYTNPKQNFAHRVAKFSVLSQPDPGTVGYDPAFSSSMPIMDGIDLDNVAKHDLSHYSEKVLASCDSLQVGTDGNFYLVEFKNQRSGNINSDEIHKKVIDTLSLILFAFSPRDSIRTLYAKTKFFVVFPDQNAFLKIATVVKNSGSSLESRPLKRPLWNLDELVKDEFIGYVDTMTLTEFKNEVLSWPAMVLP